jgi:phosphate acetyltransferase
MADPLVSIGQNENDREGIIHTFMLAKNLAYFAKADSAGIVLGARVPIMLTSRADSTRARMASAAVAALYAYARRSSAPIAAA